MAFVLKLDPCRILKSTVTTYHRTWKVTVYMGVILQTCLDKENYYSRSFPGEILAYPRPNIDGCSANPQL